MGYLLRTLTEKKEIDTIIEDTIDKGLVPRFGRPSDAVCLQLDDILAKSATEVSRFGTVGLLDIYSEDVPSLRQVSRHHSDSVYGVLFKCPPIT